MNIDEAIKDLAKMTRWHKDFWIDIRKWPELSTLVSCAQDLGADDIEQDKPEFPAEFDHFTQALVWFLNSFREGQEKP